jgi:hypothetical protein
MNNKILNIENINNKNIISISNVKRFIIKLNAEMFMKNIIEIPLLVNYSVDDGYTSGEGEGE